MPYHGVSLEEMNVRQTETNYGIESLKKEDFFHPGTNDPLPFSQIVDLVLKHKPMPEGYVSTSPENTNPVSDYRMKLEAALYDFLPKLQDIDEEKKVFLETEYGEEGTGGISGRERFLDLSIAGAKRDRARDVYGLGMSSVRREREGLKRTREASLEPLRDQASEVGKQMQQAYGSGMGTSMRGAISGQRKLARGAERVYGAYGSGMAAQKDEATRLWQEVQAAKGDFDFTQRGLGLERERDVLAYDKGIYGLEQERAGGFEGDLATMFSNLPEFKQGGRVPSKQTFLDVLSKIPDAGGS